MPGLLAAGTGKACDMPFLVLAAKVRLQRGWNSSWASVSSHSLYKGAMGLDSPLTRPRAPSPGVAV